MKNFHLHSSLTHPVFWLQDLLPAVSSDRWFTLWAQGLGFFHISNSSSTAQGLAQQQTSVEPSTWPWTTQSGFLDYQGLPLTRQHVFVELSWIELQGNLG